MPKLAFATCAAFAHGHQDDLEAARLTGAEPRVWDDPAVDWERYDLVVVRSTWDYSAKLGRFLEWADRVGARRLRNPPELIRFNADKRYLTELHVPTVPTSVLEPGAPLPTYEGEIVIKPNVSAGGRDTGRFPVQAREQALALVADIHASGRAALVQPYLQGVDRDGEHAVVFIAGEVSHVLHKRPVLRGPGVAPLADFAHGPAAVMLEPDLVSAASATDAQLRLARRALEQISRRFGTPLFARVDMVPGPDQSPVVIELEAIEPCLYLNLAPGAARRFAQAVQATAAAPR